MYITKYWFPLASFEKVPSDISQTFYSIFHLVYLHIYLFLISLCMFIIVNFIDRWLILVK